MNIDFAQRWLDAFFTGGQETADFYAPDGIFEDPILDQDVPGHTQMLRLFSTWSMEELAGTHKFVATDYLGDDKLGVFHWVWQANFPGDAFLGMPTGGAQPFIEGMTIQCYDENGKITHDWTYWDAVQCIKQLPYPIQGPPQTVHFWRDDYDPETDAVTAPRPTPPALAKLEWSPGPYSQDLLDQLRSVPRGAERVARMDRIDYAQSWLDAFFTGGPETCAFYAEDGIFEDPILDQHVPGHTQMLRLFSTWSMQELAGTHKFVATNYLGGERLGVFQWVWQANFPGDLFLGMPTGGVQPYIDGVTVQVFDEKGKVIRDWTFWDGIQLIKQLPYPIQSPPQTVHFWRDDYDPAQDDVTAPRPIPLELEKLEWSPGPYSQDLVDALRAKLSHDTPTVTSL